MNRQTGIDKLITDLIKCIVTPELVNEPQSISNAIMDVFQIKSTLADDFKKIQQIGKQSFVNQVKLQIGANVDPDPIASLVWESLNYITNAMTYAGGDKIGFIITVVFNYLLVLIADFKKSAEYCKTPITYNLTNPAQEFWFLRSDTNGQHKFNVNGNYFENIIPNASSDIYSNAEIYNSPYADMSPKCVIASPFPAEKITNENELYNFVYDLFMNIPFSSTHNVVFEANIKVGNLENGSRGWGFWNTDVLPFLGMKVAWFIQQQGLDANKQPRNQFQVWTISGVNTIDIYDVPTPLDENWHTYKIAMNSSSVEYFMDNVLIHKVAGKEGNIINGPMAFHNWVDNAFFDIKEGTKVFQDSSTPRMNFTKNMNIYTS